MSDINPYGSGSVQVLANERPVARFPKNNYGLRPTGGRIWPRTHLTTIPGMTAWYYTSQPVNLNDPLGKQFTANIYVAGGTNVGAFSIELAVDGGNPNITYAYTAAAVSGFSIAAGQGIGGFNTGQVGASFPLSGRLLGTITVTFLAAPAGPFRLAQFRWSLDDMNYTGIPVSWYFPYSPTIWMK